MYALTLCLPKDKTRLICVVKSSWWNLVFYITLPIDLIHFRLVLPCEDLIRLWGFFFVYIQVCWVHVRDMYSLRKELRRLSSCDLYDCCTFICWCIIIIIISFLCNDWMSPFGSVMLILCSFDSDHEWVSVSPSFMGCSAGYACM
jgi:hypothetical protein